MSETNIPLNLGSGGPIVASYADATSRQHQEVIMQTQNGSSDPVSVSAANPLPVTPVGPLAAGSNAIGTVGVNAALPSGTNVIGGVTQSGDWIVQGDVLAGTTDSGNSVKVGGVYNAAPPVYTTGQRADLQTDSNGFLKVNVAAGANSGGTSSNFNSGFPGAGTAVGATDGTNMRALQVDGSGNLKVNIAAGGVAAATDNTAFTAGSGLGLPILAVYNDGIANAISGDVAVPRMTVNRQLLAALQAATNGGWTPARFLSAATTNSTSVKGSAGQVGSIICGNNLATIAYLKLYNKATAPTVGTDVPVHTIMIPGSTSGAGFSYPIPAGLQFSLGIGFAITGGMADADTTAVALNQVCVNLGYV